MFASTQWLQPITVNLGQITIFKGGLICTCWVLVSKFSIAIAPPVQMFPRIDTVAPGWSVCRRGADRSSQVGCGKRASWGGGATAPPTVREASSLEKSEHYCYAYILAYIHMIAQMRGSLSSFPLMVGRNVSRLVAEVQPRQKWLTVYYLIVY